jgi:hypothetical protein
MSFPFPDPRSCKREFQHDAALEAKLYRHVPIDGAQGTLQIMWGDLPYACVLRTSGRTSGAMPHLKTVPKWPHRTFSSSSLPLPNHLHFPSTWRTLYTLLDSDGEPICTTNALPPNHCPHPSLSVEPYHDPVPEPCSTYERLSSSPLLPSSQLLSSPRTTARSSLRHKSLVRIIAIPYDHFCSSSLKCFTKIRTSSAQYILTRPLPRIYTTSQRYGSLRLSSQTIVTDKRCGRKSRLAFRTSHPRASSMEAPST